MNVDAELFFLFLIRLPQLSILLTSLNWTWALSNFFDLLTIKHWSCLSILVGVVVAPSHFVSFLRSFLDFFFGIFFVSFGCFLCLFFLFNFLVIFFFSTLPAFFAAFMLFFVLDCFTFLLFFLFFFTAFLLFFVLDIFLFLLFFLFFFFSCPNSPLQFFPPCLHPRV